MSLLMEILLLGVIFLVLKEFGKIFTGIATVLAVCVFFFLFGGKFDDVNGFIGSAAGFFKSLPTSQFLEMLTNVMKDIYNSVMGAR